MEYFAGLDVSIEETAICVVGDDGKVVLETEVPTEPELIAEALERFAGRLRRVGHEAGSVSPWLHAGLIELGLPAVCLETRHVRAALSAQRNKTDAADALDAGGPGRPYGRRSPDLGDRHPHGHEALHVPPEPGLHSTLLRLPGHTGDGHDSGRQYGASDGDRSGLTSSP